MKLTRTLPGFSSLMMMEFFFSFGIIAIVIASLIPSSGVAIQKAQLTHMFSIFSSERTERMIDMALTGEGYFPDSSLPKLYIKNTMPLVAAVALQASMAGNTIRLEGVLENPFHFTFAPSVIAEGPIGTVLWLCGNKNPPVGWTQPSHTG